MKYTLPISPEYVAHWGLWEAVREIYQNALDQAESSGGHAYVVQSGETLLISTTTGALTKETLVLGKTTKSNAPAQRGKFGEGYKLALLVLSRLGHDVYVRTGAESWQARIEHDLLFGTDVLNIYTEPMEFPEVGVTFVIHQVTEDTWSKIKGNIRPSEENEDLVLEKKEEKGRIYVGGLFVYCAKDFHYGYAFRPGRIRLDRDRGMVNGFDLAWETSKLWTERGGPLVVDLLNAEAPDVEYCEAHAQKTSPVTESYYGHYVAKHGPATVPVSTQAEIERATRAGLRWALVPQKVQNILRTLRSWFVPSAESPVERLRAFAEKYGGIIPTEANRELAEIIAAMEPTP